jgi:hypothetical protein
MRKARNYWEESCAVVAILFGLALTGMSWAEKSQWQTNANPTPTDFQCNAGTGNCKGWTSQCISKATGGLDASYFTCGNSIWNSLHVTQARAYGSCNSGSGSCTEWGTYWCLDYDVFSDGACSANNYQCSIMLALANLCDPNNPTGQ